MLILGIETSCDETAAAVVEKTAAGFVVRANVVASQVKIHARYGGVVPEVAARNHVGKIIPVIDAALKTAKVKPAQLDRIAVTVGPGLITSLLVGVQTAQALAMVWRKPLIPVNHLRAHIYAAWMPDIGKLRITHYALRSGKNSQSVIRNSKIIQFPVIALVVSGGHTELVLMNQAHHFRLLGQTLDDAAGEAFDKVATMLGLPYPGGPALAALADCGDPRAVCFPRPLAKRRDSNFSFSGLKTAVRYYLRDHRTRGRALADVAASFQAAVVDSLVPKTVAAARQHQAKTVILGGGVAANHALRRELGLAVAALGADFRVPDFADCTDNAAMIATAGWFGQAKDWRKIRVDANRPIDAR